MFAPLTTKFPALRRVGDVPKPLLLAAVAGVIAVIVAVALWSSKPAYKVLFSELQDRDGGAIVTSLTQMNVPYRFSENGTALLVPASQVYEARVQLAAQGLPRNGGTGFELLDSPRFGASQFAEQVNYQRALEGELARSIEALNPVQSARVHLALPRQSLFVRERHSPTASVLVNVYPGRSLTDAQVSAISWLLSSSVADLKAEHVSIVDQTGRLLSSPAGDGRGLDAEQTRHVRAIEKRAIERIVTILTPLVGPGNVYAQVNAEIDFSQREETAETYRPNQTPGEAAMRSQQTSGSLTAAGAGAQGVPGALSNQPPTTPQAPIVKPAASAKAGSDAAAATATSATSQLGGQGSQHNDSTTNYELDRKITHVRLPVGAIRRMSAAVVVNYRSNEAGEPEALPAEVLAQLDKLTREAMGYSESRGDSLNIVNSPFTDPLPSMAWWENTRLQGAAESALYGLGILLFTWLLWLRMLKPIWTRYITPPVDATLAELEREAQQREAVTASKAFAQKRLEENLVRAKELALKDPRAVAMVVRTWMNQE